MDFIKQFPKLFLLLIFINSLNLKAEVKITDALSGQPLGKASIFDKDGMFIGVADNEGKIPESIHSSSYPLNIRYVGYNPITVSSPDSGIVAMEESIYTLPEVVVGDVAKNILYLQVYVREYHTLDNTKDTVAIFKEQITDYAIPVGKVKYKGWKKPRLLAEQRYEYQKFDKKKNPIDTMLLMNKDKKSRTTNFDIDQKFKLPASVLSEEAKEYVKEGKYGPEERWISTDDYYVYENDGLANNKDHVFSVNFFGLLGGTQTMDESRYKFEKSPTAGAGIENLIEATHNWDMNVRGKIMKKATEQSEDTNTSFYSEMFVIDRAYLTAEEAKELKKDPPVIDIKNFKVPEGIPAPPENVVKLKNTILESVGSYN